MNIFARLKNVLISMALVVAGAVASQAATVTLTDSSLTASGDAPYGFGTRETLGSEFNAINGPMTFSGTMSRIGGSYVGAGGYNLGMTVGDLYFLVHPGYTTVPGAFRVDYWEEYDGVRVGDTLVTQHNTTQDGPRDAGSNISIGFPPNGDPIDFTVILTDAGAGNYSVDVSIIQGINSFMDTYTLAQDLFGLGGSIDSFGALHVSNSTSHGSAAYSGFTAQVGSVPEVGATGAMAAIACLLSMIALLHERRARQVLA